MIQTPASLAERLDALRREIKQRDLDGFLIPMADAYQNEYVPPEGRRIEFLTGFTGTYAFVVVLMDRAAFFTDSRYTLQASEQVPASFYSFHDIAKEEPSEWLEKNLSARMKIGFDPLLHTAKQIERLETTLLKLNATLTPTEGNPIDAFWLDKPSPILAPVVPHDLVYAGRSSEEKRKDISEGLKKKNVDAVVLTDPASIAWALNVRGGDVPMTPLPLSRAILFADGTIEWFVDPHKVPGALDKHLGPDVKQRDEAAFESALRTLGESQRRILLDPSEASYRVLSLLRESGATVERGEDPCLLARACKNPTELDGMRAAHRRDGAAMVKFMAWLDEEARAGSVTELDAASRLASFRAKEALYQEPSFETIAAAGPHGAIVHYRPTQENNARLKPGAFFLVDSGGQYLDGTTDITRTISIGEITEEMKDRYTRVLQGHIALASVRFPKGTTGAEIDVLARQFLWAAGLDYGHGTGHGVGSYLSVHEGPQSISRRGDAQLRPGMVLSNEPGYYEEGHYGIRLENLMCVVEQPDIGNGETVMMGFETLTLAPFDRRALVVEKLCKTEKQWLNAYHARVCETLLPHLDEKAAAWLKKATADL